MAHKSFNLMRETAAAPGTGSFTLLGAVQGAQTFVTRLASTNRVWYAATNGTAWEVGYGTFTSPTTLARTDIIESSNGDAVVNFSTGTVDIFCDIPASVTDSLNMIEETVASAATCNIGAVHAFRVAISGTTTITSFGTTPNKLRHVQFTGILTLTYNATSLILPGADSIITAVGDTAIFASDGSGNWRCLSYLCAAGFRLKMTSGSTVTLYTNYSTGSDTTGTGTAVSPFKSVSKAAYYFADNYDLNSCLAVVQMADNVTDLDGLHWAVHALHGAQGGASFTIKGGTNSVLKDAQSYFGSVIRYQDVQIRDGLSVDYGAFVYLSGVTIGTGPTVAAITIGFGGTVICYGALNIAGINCFAAILVAGGKFDSGGQTITVTANQTVSGGWLYVQQGGVGYFGGSTLTNSFTVTGPRYVIYDGGSVTSGNGLTTYFPGTVAGTNLSGHYDTVPATTAIANGGTASNTAAAAFAALKQPATTSVNGVVELSTDAEAIAGTDNVRALTPSNLTARFIPATTQTFASGSGTYTTPAGVKWIEVELIGGGGGGGGSGAGAPGTGGTGGNTTFSSLTGNGGVGGVGGTGGGAGGASSGGYRNIPGGNGGNGGTTGIVCAGGSGGNGIFGGAGSGGSGVAGPSVAATNSGGGGGGGLGNTTYNSGGGGGAGGSVAAAIYTPAATYSYAVGAAGAGGATGGGQAGSAGAAGFIVIREYY